MGRGYTGLTEKMNEVLRVLIVRPRSHHTKVTAATYAASGFTQTAVLCSGVTSKNIFLFI